VLLSVTRPLEQAAMEVPGILRVRSRTFRGSAEISAQFAPDADMAAALQLLQSGVDEARSEMPADVQAQTQIQVERLTAASFPVLSLNLTGNLSSADLRDYAFFVVRPALSRVPGVGRVEVMASDSREIEVVPDPERLLAARLTVHDVAEALRKANQLAPVARYSAAGRQTLVLASGLFTAPEQIAQTPVVVRDGAAVRVSDLAAIFPGVPDRTSLVTGGGRDAAAIINVSQQPGASILDVQKGVDQALKELAKSLPSGLRIAKVYDLADFVATAITNVRDAILIGGVLAVIVLLLFLRDWRVTLVSAVTLPLTVLSTFLFLRVLHESINLMSMGGLAVAIGLVIDDAVVVVENIFRRMEAGGSADAVWDATAELVAPVVGSTLTTVVVLLPLGLLSGVVGQFFRSLSLTLSVAVLISLFLALGLIPLLAQFAYRRRGEGGPATQPEKHRGAGLERMYGRSLHAVTSRPLLAGLAVLALGLAGYLLYRQMPSGFLPQMDEGGFVIDYLTPPGSALEESDRLIRKAEALVAATPEVASFSRRTGSELGLFATEQNKGDILVRLKPRGERSRSSEQVIEELRGKLNKALPGVDIEFVQLLQDMIGDLEGAPTPIEVKIFGDDPAQLDRLAEEVEPILSSVRGVVDVVGVERGGPEQTWEIDPVAAGRAGLTVEDVTAQLAAGFLGEDATSVRRLDRQIPVRVRYPDAVRFDPSRLASAPLRTADGKLVPFSSLGRSTQSAGESLLQRENLRQMALISGHLEGRDLGSAVQEVRSRLAKVRLPVGYTAEVGGQYESQRQAFRELLMVFGIAASLVFLVIVFELRALTPAFLIVGAAPLSLAGAFLLLLATGTDLNVSAAMGLILLVGLVVKNGIVMMDYAHHMARTMPFPEAVEHAAQVRLRPILMTTLCTLFGLLPLALGLGAGAELQKPLALAVIGGLGLSTLVTLYLVPSIYIAAHRRGTRRLMRPPVLCVLFTALLLLPAASAQAALSNPKKEDIDFIAEHLPEAAQDARWLSLSTLHGPLAKGTWETSAQVGYSRATASLFRIDGPMVSLGAGYAFRDGWAIQGLGFYDSLSISGDTAREVLHPFFSRRIPLDLPENADFSHPRGDYRHWGIGGALVHRLSPGGTDKYWTLTAGLLYDRTELDNFQVDYRIAGGASAGAAGTLDHSGTADFALVYLVLQQVRPLGSRFRLVPRFTGGVPYPKGDFNGRLTGPGFTAGGGDDPTRRPGAIGDGFFGFGAEIEHVRSGLSLDLGGTLAFPLVEKLTHEGVSQAINVQITWRR
jgi:CzcA family heavy metal efflux pump